MEHREKEGSPGREEDCGETGERAHDPGSDAPEGAGHEAAGDEDRENILKLLAAEKSRSEEYYNRLARMQADFENFRKRVAREREDLLKYSGEQLIAALLPVVDNFERALAVKNNDYEKLLAGVDMIYRQLEEILAREGLLPIPAAGEQFNPELHEAVMKDEGGDYPENTVTEELRRGYTFKGKVLRAAMVKVKG